MIHRLSKRILFSSEDSFIQSLKDFNRAVGDPRYLGYQPFATHVSGGKSSYTKMSENPDEFKRIMGKVIKQVIKKLDEVGTRDRKALLSGATGDLLREAHSMGMIPASIFRLWGLQVMNSVKSGSPFSAEIEKAKATVSKDDPDTTASALGWFFTVA